MKNSTQNILVIAVIVVVGYLFFSITSPARPAWPTISDKDKTDILDTISSWNASGLSGHIERDKWTPAIRSLKPRSVEFDGKRINILLSGGGVSSGWGYLISPIPITDLEGHIPIESEDLRFQRYEQQN